ncbi:MAG: acyl-CoA dehydrogenase domain-containing protein, partial [Arcobacter sp.]|uniref:acyl-CoA dehydrogenase domain-containing protein n=1 Tax=Arcobacter sp. TaxID=1872629 RepID=UPI003D0F8545
KAKDKLNAKIVKNLSNQDYLQKLTSSLFISKNEKDRLTKLQLAVKLNKECESSFKILKDAIKNGTIKKDSPENMTKELLEKNLLSKEEIEKMLEAHALKQEVISVDSFDAKEYKAQK